MFSHFRYIFFGGRDSDFAEIILNGLIDKGIKPVAAIRNAKDPLDMDYLKSLKADFFVVASFGKILKKEVLEIPKNGVIGVHPSLLPKYRGPSPIQSALLNDEKETGVSLFLIDEKIDHGPILAISSLRLATSDNYESLIKKLAELSVNMLIEALPQLFNNKIQPQIQDESLATFTRKFTAEDAYVDLEKDDLKKVWLKIRALNPEPGIYTILKLKNNKEIRLKLLEADFSPEGKLELKTVQPEGKKPMAYRSFLNGYKK